MSPSASRAWWKVRREVTYISRRDFSELSAVADQRGSCLDPDSPATLSTARSAPPAAATSQNVTIPVIPELYDPNFLDLLLPKCDAPPPVKVKPEEPAHPMIDVLKSTLNHTRTTNDDPAYSSTSSPILDVFRNIGPYCAETCLRDVLPKAWEEDPALTLRVIWNSRSIHDGKRDHEGFYHAFGWLYENHPRTAIQNLDMLVRPVCKIRKDTYASHGYWKDLLNIVALAATNELRLLNDPATFLHKPRKAPQETKVKRPREEADAAVAREKAEAQELRVTRQAQLHTTLVQQLENPRFRALYIAVARLFAQRLAEDRRLALQAEAMEDGHERNAILHQISLAGKWAPTPGKAHDRVTNLASAISMLLHHSFSLGPSLPVSPNTPTSPLDTHILRSFYQRHILTLLRKVTGCPESLMSKNRWSEIVYPRVPSVCMENNTANFYNHDQTRFEQYITDTELGKGKINGATLLPHKILERVFECGFDWYRTLQMQPEEDSQKDPGVYPRVRSNPEKSILKGKVAAVKLRVLESQWKVMVDHIREAGALDNCLAVCDVSGSMGNLMYHCGTKRVWPIFPAVALSLVVSELAKPPFANKCITFSAEPKFVEMTPGTIIERVVELEKGEWGLNTAFDKVFLDLLLPLAIKHNLKPEDMIKRLFVFTDMQFDEAGEHNANNAATWETSHDVVERKFREAGYELPEIVYWDLNPFACTTPVLDDRKGVVLMNGFSPSMLKVFMGEEADEAETAAGEEAKQNAADETPATPKPKIDPMSFVIKAVSRESYDGLVVID